MSDWGSYFSGVAKSSYSSAAAIGSTAAAYSSAAAAKTYSSATALGMDAAWYTAAAEESTYNAAASAGSVVASCSSTAAEKTKEAAAGSWTYAKDLVARKEVLEGAQVAAGSATTGGVAAGGLVAAQGAASALVPLSMQTFGTVVSGVGTYHAAGGVTATLQMFAAGTIGPTVAGVFATGVVGYGAYYYLSKSQKKAPATGAEVTAEPQESLSSIDEVPALAAYAVRDPTEAVLTSEALLKLAES